MEAWPRSFSSFPTNSSLASTSSSSCCLPLTTDKPSVVDLVDELWFFRSVVPFPSLTLPCLPSPSSSSSYSPDSSTLIAQLMCSTPDHYTSPSPRLPLSSSSSSAPLRSPQQQDEKLPLQNQMLPYDPWPFPFYDVYLPPSDGEDEENTEDEDEVDEEEVEPADPLNLDAEDALSGIYDVGVLLKDQHLKRRQGGQSATLQETWLQVTPRRELKEGQNISTKVNSSKVKGLRELDTVEMTPHVANVLDVFEDDGCRKSLTASSCAPFHTKAWSAMSALPNLQVSAPNEQVDMKEHLKLWAHTVASTLHREP